MVKIFSAPTVEQLEEQVNSFTESSEILWQMSFSHSDKFYMVLRDFIPKQLVDFIVSSLPHVEQLPPKPIHVVKVPFPKAAPKKAAIKKIAKKVAVKKDADKKNPE